MKVESNASCKPSIHRHMSPARAPRPFGRVPARCPVSTSPWITSPCRNSRAPRAVIRQPGSLSLKTKPTACAPSQNVGDLRKTALAQPRRCCLNQRRQHKTPTRKQHNIQFAASAAVQDKTGTFERRTLLEARPKLGVPKAFLLGYTSTCLGA